MTVFQQDSIDFRYNSLTGPLPTEVGKMSLMPSFYAFSDNSLTGNVPTEVGDLVNLNGTVHFR